MVRQSKVPSFPLIFRNVGIVGTLALALMGAGISASAREDENEAPKAATLQPSSPIIKQKLPTVQAPQSPAPRSSSLPGGVQIDKNQIQKPKPGPIVIPDKVLKPVPQITMPTLPSAPVEWKTMTAVLPGDSVSSDITYMVENGVAILDGDMVMGPADKLNEIWAPPIMSDSGTASNGDGTSTRRQGLNATMNTDMLWPDGRIPYIAANLPALEQTELAAAIQTLNSRTNLNIVPRTNEKDYVKVIIDKNIPGAGRAEYGRQGGVQSVRLKQDECGRSCIIHEFLHAAGFAHEQSRLDRDKYIEIIDGNIDPDGAGNFKVKKGSQPVGQYDFRSIMHYHDKAFRKDGCVGNACITIRAKASVGYTGTLGGGTLTDTDIRGINAAYPSVAEASGFDWGTGNTATSVAVGDFNGDGRADYAFGRKADGQARVKVYDGSRSGNRSVIFETGADWGDGAYVTDVAFGDVDGDGRLEFGVTRKSGTNSRYFIYDDLQAGGSLIESGGADWGGNYYATSIAFGDVDKDGRDELAIGRKAGEHGRYYLFDDARAPQPFKRLAIGGADWGSGGYTTALSFGDVDGDGRDELGVARMSGTNMRYEIVKFSGGSFQQLFSGGNDWGSSNHATSIAIGNIDGDPQAEILVGRRAGENARFFILDDKTHGFALIEKGGDLWGSSYYTVGVGIADLDGDGPGELIVARHAGENKRLHVFGYDPATGKSHPLPYNEVFIGNTSAVDVAAGDIDGDGKADIVIANNASQQGQPRFQTLLSDNR